MPNFMNKRNVSLFTPSNKFLYTLEQDVVKI